jgi:hypothetical protein
MASEPAADELDGVLVTPAQQCSGSWAEAGGGDLGVVDALMCSTPRAARPRTRPMSSQ